MRNKFVIYWNVGSFLRVSGFNQEINLTFVMVYDESGDKAHS